MPGLDEAALELKREQTKDDLAAIVKDMIEKKISLDSPNALGATPVPYPFVFALLVSKLLSPHQISPCTCTHLLAR